jgi:hypothetical protein
MRKLIKYLVVLLAGFLWFLGCSRDTVVYLVDQGIVQDDFRYGDLYRLSNLKEYKEEVVKCKKPFSGENAPVTLYLSGDSFTETGRVSPDSYAGVGFFRSAVNTPDLSLELVEGKKILVIETVERHTRERFGMKPWMGWMPKPEKAPVEQKKSWWDSLVEWELPYREEMHESVLFSAAPILRIKEWKAGFHKRFFNRVDPKVGVLDEHLVYELDLEPGISSVFDPVGEEELGKMVQHMNRTRELYRDMGFDEVYISIIPNKSSLLLTEDARYNRLVERIERHADLEVPLISVWEDFQRKDYYMKGDSHWNCEGQQIWVDKVNRILTE